MKDLYIVVSAYPYQHSEAFLEDALPIFSKNFRKIYFVIPEKSRVDFSRKRWTPDNSDIILLDCNTGIFSLLYFIITLPFHSDFWRELLYIYRSYKLPFRMGLLKMLVAFCVKSISFKSQFLPYLSRSKNEIVLYTYWCTEFTYACSTIKKQRSNVQLATSIHGWDAYFERNELNYLPMRTAIFSTIDRIFPISEHGKKYLANKIPSFDTNKLEISYLGTQKGEFINYDDRENEFRILTVAILMRVKRIDRVPEALSLIKDIKIKWIHVGGGNETALIQSKAKELLGHKTNISYELLGMKNKDEIYALMRDGGFHCILNTSESEGLPVSIMEAFSFGIPAIAPNVGGVSEMVSDGVTGVLMSHQSTSEEIGVAIRKIKGLSKEEFLQYRRNSLHTWEQNFDSSVNYEKTAKSLNNL